LLGTLNSFKNKPNQLIKVDVSSQENRIPDFRLLEALGERVIRDLRQFHFQEKIDRIRKNYHQVAGKTHHVLTAPYRGGIQLKNQWEWNHNFQRFDQDQDRKVQEILNRLEKNAAEPARH
jgi:hypothetical protein